MNKHIKNLANSNLDDTYIFHIPHSGNMGLNKSDFLITEKELNDEHNKLSDLATDLLFKTEFTSMVFPYSRLYCDVERLPDEQEVMFKFGRGFYYTKTDDGRELRDGHKKEHVKILYNTWHNNLLLSTKEKIEKYGIATIIDCHSFSDTPFESDLIKDGNRPDICLGVDEYHTPKYIVEFIKQRFKNEGYTVGINNPYSGTIVPLEFYKKDKRVQSIMIEVNRKLFYDNNKPNIEKVKKLNTIIKKILNYEDY